MERKKDMGMEAVVNFENSTMCREIDKPTAGEVTIYCQRIKWNLWGVLVQ